MKFRKDKESKPIPILLDKALRDRIEAISERMGEAKSTVMRIAMRIGFDNLEAALEVKPVSPDYGKAIAPFSVMADSPKIPPVPESELDTAHQRRKRPKK